MGRKIDLTLPLTPHALHERLFMCICVFPSPALHCGAHVEPGRWWMMWTAIFNAEETSNVFQATLVRWSLRLRWRRGDEGRMLRVGGCSERQQKPNTAAEFKKGPFIDGINRRRNTPVGFRNKQDASPSAAAEDQNAKLCVWAFKERKENTF